MPEFFVLSIGLFALGGCARRTASDTDTVVAGTIASDTVTSNSKAHEFTHQLAPVFSDELTAVDFAIPVTNDTGRTVRFEVVSSSCSCTKSNLRQRELLPGDKTVLEGQISLQRELGKKGVRLLLRDEQGPAWTYDVQMQCYRKIVLPLNGILSFGEVDALGTYTKSLPLTTYVPAGHLPALFVAAQCDDDRIKVGVANAASEKLEDGVTCHRGKLSVELIATPRAEIESAVVTITTQAGGAETQHELHVHWRLSTVFAIDPPRLFFRQGADDTFPMEKKVAIKRRDGKPFSITGISGVDDAFDIRVNPVPGQAGTAEVIVKLASHPERDIWSKLCLETDARDQEKVYLPVAGLFKTRGRP